MHIYLVDIEYALLIMTAFDCKLLIEILVVVCLLVSCW